MNFAGARQPGATLAVQPLQMTFRTNSAVNKIKAKYARAVLAMFDDVVAGRPPRSKALDWARTVEVKDGRPIMGQAYRIERHIAGGVGAVVAFPDYQLR